MNGELKFGLVLTVPVLLLVVAGFLGIPGGYNEMHPERRFQPPGPAHPLGTDNFGRDILRRVIAGSRHTITLAVFTVAGAVVLGSVLGLFAGYSGGILERLSCG